MKKLLLSVLMMSFLTSVGFCACNVPNNDNCECNKSKTQTYEKRIERDKCEKCPIDDDEYCIYNECFFDKQYRKMKTDLCPTKNQECKIDNIYRTFKTDMENIHSRYRIEKNKLLEMIECNNDCYKNQIKVLKDIKKECKEKLKDYNNDVKEQLCKNQYSDFRKFKREQKKKMKKIIKYGAIYKLPCVDCCK